MSMMPLWSFMHGVAKAQECLLKRFRDFFIYPQWYIEIFLLLLFTKVAAASHSILLNLQKLLTSAALDSTVAANWFGVFFYLLSPSLQ